MSRQSAAASGPRAATDTNTRRYPTHRALLILDPHYSGGAGLDAAESDASRRALWGGGWVSWKPLSALRQDSFYNLALPRPPAQAGAASAPQTSPAGGGGGGSATDWESLIEVVEQG